MDLSIHIFSLNRKHREKIKKQKACTIWLTGLSGSGKSTISNELEIKLNKLGYHTFALDGDNTRMGLNKGLGFSEEDRSENIRRAAEVCKLMNDAGLIVISSFISPFNTNRELAKSIIGGDYVEVFVDTDIDVCITRDPKGLYKKAISGEIQEFTGISSPYEPPVKSIQLINNNIEDLSRNVEILLKYLKNNNYIK